MNMTAPAQVYSNQRPILEPQSEPVSPALPRYPYFLWKCLHDIPVKSEPDERQSTARGGDLGRRLRAGVPDQFVGIPKASKPPPKGSCGRNTLRFGYQCLRKFALFGQKRPKGIEDSVVGLEECSRVNNLLRFLESLGTDNRFKGTWNHAPTGSGHRNVRSLQDLRAASEHVATTALWVCKKAIDTLLIPFSAFEIRDSQAIQFQSYLAG